ncbi:DUF2919 family protein [Thalassotalea euphylliae]|uniref:DUF2919 family protein n=1 Tax=Thalassotalea euphylliae TaxID=1655234 RepID=UPI00363F0EA1
MNKAFSRYSVKDFDNFDCVKLSKTIYLALAFLLRGYLVWLMSVTNMQDRVGVISWIYPDPELFYLNLASGFMGVILVFVISLRRPNASHWVKRVWPHTRTLIAIACLLDIGVLTGAYLLLQLGDMTSLLLQAVVALFCVAMCYFSKRLAYNLQEFPEPVPEK